MASTSSLTEPKQPVQRRKSCDTVCSSSSSCYLQKRKPINPLARPVRALASRNGGNNNAVKQRVLSARLLKLRSLQNQLNDANYHLAELQRENRALRNLQTRQDKALSKYEGANADLPKLIKSFEEEVRILTAKNKTLRKSGKEVSDQLKMKEEEMASIKETVKSLTNLAKQKNLGERQALAEQVEDLKEKLKNSNDQISLLNRKIQLESKNYKYKLNSEIMKHKQTQKELLQALAEINRLNSFIEGKGKAPLGRKRFVTVNHRQSMSTISLDEKPSNKDLLHKSKEVGELRVSFSPADSKSTSNLCSAISATEDEVDNLSDHSDVKLEPISSEKDGKFTSSMTPPRENIKARLSADPPNDKSRAFMESPPHDAKTRFSADSSKSQEIDEINEALKKLHAVEDESHPTIAMDLPMPRRNSFQKQEKVKSGVETLFTRPSKTKTQERIEQRLGESYDQMQSVIKDYSSVVDAHRADYETAQNETEKLLTSLREVDNFNAKIRHLKLYNEDSLEIPHKDIDVAKEIVEEEYMFRKGHPTFLKSDKNGNVVKKEEVAPNEKSKLLAALKAIDNGEEIEEIKYKSLVKRTDNLVDELFGNIHK